ncbi:MAG TPA: sugar kinase [Baekduia sp.]|nr:sugar kinase [Baekduia sp.]
MRSPEVVTAGEALLAVVPSEPLPFEDASSFLTFVGGAEVNFAICLSQLGVDVAWHGHLGDDPAGRKVLRALTDAEVSTALVRSWPDERTGLYLRDWRPDGVRRPSYYRARSAARHLHPRHWPADATATRWLHLTGITAALGDGPRALLEHLLEWARASGLRISFDPNYRPALWSAAEAAPVLRALAAQADVVLLSEEDAELLFGDLAPEATLEAALGLGPGIAVLKRGARGALAAADGVVHHVAPAPAQAVDPVGAGDAFDAGLVAALLERRPLEEALRLGALLGARATEQAGEHPPAVVPSARAVEIDLGRSQA